MPADSPRVYTIASDRPFLAVLAEAVLAGFPIDGGRPGPFELPRWTILLPTRRAVRELETVFFAKAGGAGLLLPRIRPIGDIDEDVLEDDRGKGETFPQAMSGAGQLLTLIDLIDDWARDNPQTALAREVAASPHQAHGLAVSLRDLLDDLETGEADAAGIPDLYDLESSRHREDILELLRIAQERYPAQLVDQGRMSAAARRSALLRHEARRLAALTLSGPIIAAGSTGTIPATRDLLKAIASLPQGAVVLPGLDTGLDAASWEAVGPQHPQHALKQLVAALGADHAAVPALPGGEGGARAALASEIMRPAETSDAWREAIAASAIGEAATSVELIAAPHRQSEAEVIALILRHALETPGKTASLVTPDRALARRVKTELQRWRITIDDSGGEPLLRFGGASLLHLLIDAVLSGFDATSLASLMRHPLFRLGREPAQARHCVSVIELAGLRAGPGYTSPGALPHLLRSRMDSVTTGERQHLALQRLPKEDWEEAMAFARDAASTLRPLLDGNATTLAEHLGALLQVAQTLAGDALWEGDESEALRRARDELVAESAALRQCNFERAATIIRHHLGATALRPRNPRRSRLAILGLLEARLVQSDLVVLGGLNEGTWPGIADAGPWLNRPMRDALGMHQPERAIGQMAHDFVQSLAAPDVKLTWSRRIDDAPAIPSRWVLRLQMILKASGLDHRMGQHNVWLALARAMNDPPAIVPRKKPKPCPPVGARPRRLSVTSVETLIRDPYAIYARQVLKLEPVKPIGAEAGSAERGSAIHAAIAGFLNAHPVELPGDPLAELLRHGRAAFDALGGGQTAESFWWPRFQRIAAWLVEQEQGKRLGLRRVLAEVKGRLEPLVLGEPIVLTCRADRIDLLKSGGAEITDYKTGQAPSGGQVNSGLAPQLTLMAAILERGGFQGVDGMKASGISYVKLRGGDPPGESTSPKLDADLSTLSGTHLEKLVGLLSSYMNPEQSYLPRALAERDDDVLDYDHLSRYREWALT